MKRGPQKSALEELTEQPRVVRLFQPFGLCQLFRPMVKARGPRPTLNETYVYGEDLSLRFSAREALAAPEQTLLLVLLELAHEQHLRKPSEHHLDRTNRTEIGTQLWSALHEESPRSLLDAPATLMFSCSWSELHRRCGSTSTGGAVTHSRRMSLVRLCEVTVWEESEARKVVRSGRLVSWLVGDDQRVHVALNHRLASALLNSGYAKLLLSERLKLNSDTAMLVHAFLSTCLGRGQSLSINYTTLVERLWPATGAPVLPVTQRRRLGDVRRALRAIGQLENWSVSLGAFKAAVFRAKTVGSSGPRTASSEKVVSHVPTRDRIAPAREMTSISHFEVSTSSYVERPFWKVPSAAGDSPRNDEVGNTLK